jgi:hypothetical protein
MIKKRVMRSSRQGHLVDLIKQKKVNNEISSLAGSVKSSAGRLNIPHLLFNITYIIGLSHVLPIVPILIFDKTNLAYWVSCYVLYWELIST